MKKKIFTSSYLGLESYLVEVEVDISRGLPMFSIVGMRYGYNNSCFSKRIERKNRSWNAWL